jgi:hypothetical protein
MQAEAQQWAQPAEAGAQSGGARGVALQPKEAAVPDARWDARQQAQLVQEQAEERQRPPELQAWARSQVQQQGLRQPEPRDGPWAAAPLPPEQRARDAAEAPMLVLFSVEAL